MIEFETLQVVNLIVSGFYYSLDPLDIERYPDCYFSHLLKDKWNRDKSAVIHIDRDGRLFRFVSSYIHVGVFESGKQCTPLDQYVAIRREADFYNLPSMVKMCDENIFWRMQYDENYTGNVTSVCASPPYPIHMYHCEQDFGEPSALTIALHDSVRPPVAAIAAITLSHLLHTHLHVHIEHLRIQRSSYHNCFNVTSRFIGPATALVEATGKVTHWPLHFDERTSLHKSSSSAYSYTRDGYCTSRTYMFSDEYPNIIGTIICVPNSCVYTGGRITATAYGQTVSIDKPGQCMALVVGAQYSVETVASGELVIFEMYVAAEEKDTQSDSESDSEEESNEVQNRLKWSTGQTFANALCKEDVELRTLALTAALDVELESYAGVVICLTHYYPVTHSPDPEDNHIYTDPDVLKELDKVLYDLLVQEGYTVTVVTVYVNRKRLSSSSVCTTTGCVVDRSILPDAEGAKYKIVPVVYGYGKNFTAEEGKEVGSLVTGLLVTPK